MKPKARSLDGENVNQGKWNGLGKSRNVGILDLFVRPACCFRIFSRFDTRGSSEDHASCGVDREADFRSGKEAEKIRDGA